MKKFLEEYGFAILTAIVVILLITMCTPIGSVIKNSIADVILGFSGKVEKKLTKTEDTKLRKIFLKQGNETGKFDIVTSSESENDKFLVEYRTRDQYQNWSNWTPIGDSYLSTESKDHKGSFTAKINSNEDIQVRVKDVGRDDNIYYESEIITYTGGSSTEQKDLEAVYNAYNINYHIEDGTNNPDNPLFYKMTDEVVLKEPSRIGYGFEGWFKDANFKKPIEKIELGSKGDIDIYAKWKIKQFTITFDSDGGSDVAPITKDFGTAISAPGNPTKANNDFIGWEPELPATMPGENLTVKALWTLKKFTITGVSADTTKGTVQGTVTDEYGKTITLIAIANDGYMFKKWSDGDTTNPRSITISQDKTYTAEFEDELIIYDLGSAKSFDIKTLLPEVDYTTLTDANFKFIGLNGISTSGRLYGEDAYWTWGVTKSYNANTGILSAYSYLGNQFGNPSANAHMVYVSKPENLINVGYGSSVNVSSILPDIYKNLSADNFVADISVYEFTRADNPETWSGGISYNKSYNASTGVISSYCKGTLNARKGRDYPPWGTTIYYIPGITTR